jgi:hypothetical protein
MTGFLFLHGLEPSLRSDCIAKMIHRIIFFYARIGSSPSWGAKQVNHLHGFRVSGFLFGASFGPVCGGNSLFSGHKLMTVLNENG